MFENNVTEYTVYAVGAPIVIALILIESLVSSSKKLGYYKRGDSMGTIGLIIGNVIVNLLTKTSILGFYLFLYQYKLFDISSLSLWTQVISTLMVIDFIYYWFHRTSHRVRFFWGIHMNHHSSEEMNFLVSLRQAWFNPLFRVPFFFILPLIGFNPFLTFIVGAASTLWAVIQHTQTIGKLGPLEWVMVTPSAHRVHHGVNEEYLNKNFGNLFIIWDRIFGTYAEEKEAVIFGLTNNVKTFNPLRITVFSWVQFINDFKQSKNLRGKFMSFFGSPEWSPESS
ncbi:MAG: sterol desaturase family protein [Gammaproteobacteria bacterium]|jgi:sterol desaturase/sphingolipid hydroxylase (fatty acid hydroxylase superfamily)|nr:sterol desaturase family protein [Gammaproteobacteria bacterium]|tara:strand:+ start:3576 stop:4421 length:846 start_codon:yes stop_codon:yes gene_type:complete